MMPELNTPPPQPLPAMPINCLLPLVPPAPPVALFFENVLRLMVVPDVLRLRRAPPCANPPVPPVLVVPPAPPAPPRAVLLVKVATIVPTPESSSTAPP